MSREREREREGGRKKTNMEYLVVPAGKIC
jgi:hypothetical protein